MVLQQLSKVLTKLPSLVKLQEDFNRVSCALGPNSRTIARLQRLQSSLAASAEAFRALASRSVILLKIVYDYRNSVESKNGILEMLLRKAMLMDISTSEVSKAPNFDGPFELLHGLPEQRREMFAESGVQWLVDILESMKRPIEQILDFEQHIPYGAPGNQPRNIAIYFLALRFEQIFGQVPTSTPSGRFVLLCELALDAIGLRTEGLEKAVARILRSRREHVLQKDGRGTQDRTSAVVGEG